MKIFKQIYKLVSSLAAGLMATVGIWNESEK